MITKNYHFVPQLFNKRVFVTSEIQFHMEYFNPGKLRESSYFNPVGIHDLRLKTDGDTEVVPFS